MKIGILIKKLRIEKRISQGELAKVCKLSQNSLSQIELGLKRPSSKNLTKICEVLEVPESLLYLYGLEENDIPERKKEIFNIMYPVLKEFIEKLVLN